MDRHNVVLRIMAESYNEPFDNFIETARSLGYLDANNRPTQLGINENLFKLDYSIPQRINNFNDEFETYVYFHGEVPVISNVKALDRSILVDAKAFATLTGCKDEEDLMLGNNIGLDIINLVMQDTGQPLMERANIEGTEKQYFKIGLYLQWAKDFINN